MRKSKIELRKLRRKAASSLGRAVSYFGRHLDQNLVIGLQPWGTDVIFRESLC